MPTNLFRLNTVYAFMQAHLYTRISPLRLPYNYKMMEGNQMMKSMIFLSQQD